MCSWRISSSWRRLWVCWWLVLWGPCVGVAHGADSWAQHQTAANAASWVTAGANILGDTLNDWRASNRRCQFIQMGIREGVGNASVLITKHFVHSARPDGSGDDGFPSGHTMNAFVGASHGWRFGLSYGLAVGTGGLRIDAGKHTRVQVLAGAAYGIGADLLGRWIHGCGP